MHSIEYITNALTNIMNSNPNMNAPVYFGTLKFAPSEPMASQYGGFDRFVTVDTGDYGDQRVWFKTGYTFDHLQAGDTVMLDYKSGKWKLSKQQAPELKMLLQSRAPKQAAPQSPTPAPSVTPIRTEQRVGEASRREDPTTLMIRIFLDLKRGLTHTVPDDVIAKLACTIFIQMTK